jgi:hypothetical protein
MKLSSSYVIIIFIPHNAEYPIRKNLAIRQNVWSDKYFQGDLSRKESNSLNVLLCSDSVFIGLTYPAHVPMLQTFIFV